MTDDYLTDEERAHMRRVVEAFMLERPARTPYYVRALDQSDAFLQLLRVITSARAGRAVAAAAVVLCASLGTSLAAEGALPGDLLYAVKRGVNEPAIAMLAVSPLGHATYDAELAVRRLEEAEQLAVQNKLTRQTSEDIKANLLQVAADFNANVVALATSSESGTAEAVGVQSDLEASLAAHAQVVATLSTALPAASSTLTPIADAIQSNLSATRIARAKIDGSLEASSSVPLAAAASQSSDSAAQALESVKSLASEVATDLGTSTSAAVAAKADVVRRTVDAGNGHMKAKNYRSAIAAFQSAIQAAADTRAAVDATVQLKKIAPDLPESVSPLSIDSEVGGTSMATTTSPYDLSNPASPQNSIDPRDATSSGDSHSE